MDAREAAPVPGSDQPARGRVRRFVHRFRPGLGAPPALAHTQGQAAGVRHSSGAAQRRTGRQRYKAFFLLTYLKNNSLQQYQAASFGISQARVSQLAAGLLPMLNQVLARCGLLPVRDGAGLAQRLTTHPTPVLACDGVDVGCRAIATTRRRPRNTAPKKVHYVKNMTLCDATQYVHHLSPTEAGRQHDKRLADEYTLQLPAGRVLWQAPQEAAEARADVFATTLQPAACTVARRR